MSQTQCASPLLRLESVCKSFGGVRAVDQLSLELKSGELVALIGPNGAGKSTCFNLINGHLHPDSGAIYFDGKALLGTSPRAIWRIGMSRTFQIAATFASLSAVENVQMALLSRDQQQFAFSARVMARHAAEALDLLTQVGMQSEAKRACGILAYGDIKRVELAIALANRPRLLLMDEPTAGMAAKERQHLMALTKRLVVEREMAVLFTEHSMDVVFANADRIVVLARGKKIAEGDGTTIRADRQVQDAYFGSGNSFEPHTRGGS